jgi:DNA-binding transcriptional regulator YiaG
MGGIITAEEIKKLRKQLGLSQESFAQLVGVSFQTINRWERGIFKPSRLAVDKIASLISKNNEANDG